jgi:hypothetical protein
MFFVIPNQSACPSSPDDRKPISVAIPFDHLRNKEAMVQKANVSHGETKMDTKMRRTVALRSSSKVVI